MMQKMDQIDAALASCVQHNGDAESWVSVAVKITELEKNTQMWNNGMRSVIMTQVPEHQRAELDRVRMGMDHRPLTSLFGRPLS